MQTDWNSIVQNMVARGAPASDAEVKVIAEYLGKTLRSREGMLYFLNPKKQNHAAFTQAIRTMRTVAVERRWYAAWQVRNYYRARLPTNRRGTIC